MLPKINRLTSKFDYAKVKKYGNVVNSESFLLSYLKDKYGGDFEPKIGLLVTNKVDNRSAVRHRLKRMLLEAVFVKLAGFHRGFYYVFIIKSAMLKSNYEKISAELDNALSKVSVI